MKIPYGYGKVYIQFLPGSQPDGIGKSMTMSVDTNTSNYEIVEFADRWLTLNRNKEKDIYGYHFNWNLTLIDEDLLGSSNQDDLCNFLYYYNRSTSKDKAFKIVPYYSDADNYSTWLAQNINNIYFDVITTEEPVLENFVSNTRAKGQKLSLKIETKFLIPKDSYNYLVYRDTTTGNWGTLLTSTYQMLGTSSAAGTGRPLGSPIANLITDANDVGFKDGDIGNWVAYSDGSGTAAYIADSPAAGDKVAKVTVDGGGDAGTYSGMSLPTTAITAFVNGTTYKLRARVYLPSTNNNFTKLSIAPTAMTGWTLVSETTATLTTEDEWQTVEAIYTAAADVTGSISLIGLSTTGNDFYYVDDIEITLY